MRWRRTQLMDRCSSSDRRAPARKEKDAPSDRPAGRRDHQVGLLAHQREGVVHGCARYVDRAPEGASISRIRKMAPAIDSAQTKSAMVTVLLPGANRPKLPKMTASQKTRTTMKGIGSDV